jgi:hypothetical protein
MVVASFLFPAVGGYVTPSVIELFLSVVIAGVVVFYAAKTVRAKEGLELKYIYSSIPPE